MRRKDIFWTILIVTLLALVVQGFAAKKSDPYQDFDTLATVFEKVKQNYVVDVDDKQLFEGAIRGALMSLDRYSSYISPDDLDEFKTQTKGEFFGLGIELGVRNAWLTVIAPMEDTPAWRAGIRAGDRIVKIEGKSTEGLTVDKAVKILRGPKGTTVNISIRHEGERKDVDVAITRDVIPLLSVRGYKRSDTDGHWDWFVDPVHKIGYLRLSAFQENSLQELEKAIAEMQEKGMKGLVIDLRFNPGGLLSAAVTISDKFIEDGIIVSTRGRAYPSESYKAHKAGTYPNFPLAVLINNWSASASEIFAGAVQDHHRGVLVGDKSFGKGSVQNVIPLQGGKAALKLTTARYYTPSGRSIHREEGSDIGGLTPDILVETDIETKVKIQQNWQKLAAPPKPEEKKPEGEVKAPAPAPEDEADLATGETAAKAKEAPFVDEQLMRAVDAVKAMLVMAEPAAPDQAGPAVAPATATAAPAPKAGDKPME